MENEEMSWEELRGFIIGLMAGLKQSGLLKIDRRDWSEAYLYTIASYPKFRAAVDHGKDQYIVELKAMQNVARRKFGN